MARWYIGAVLLGQAVVTFATGFTGARGLALQVVAVLCLLVPLIPVNPSAALRFWATVPAVAASLVWAFLTGDLGMVAWLGWAGMIAWVCIPAGPHATDTLAVRFHSRPLNR